MIQIEMFQIHLHAQSEDALIQGVIDSISSLLQRSF